MTARFSPLIMSLADVPHTLTLTKQAGFLVNIDCVDSVRPVVPVGLTNLGSN